MSGPPIPGEIAPMPEGQAPAPDLIGQVDVAVAPPFLVGVGPLGERRVIPILGGRVGGPWLEERCCPAAPVDMARLLRGEPVPPGRVHFRTAPVFETASPAHAWLHRSLFLGMGERRPDSVRVRIYAV